MIVVKLSETEALMLKQCLVALSRSNPELYPTVEVLLSAVIRAEQDNGRA